MAQYHRTQAGIGAMKRADVKRRALKQSAYVEEIDRLELYIRDVGVCQECLVPISEQKLVLDWLNGKSESVVYRPSEDHIVPLSKGGEHSYENVQLMHFGCNSSKNNRGHEARSA
jgi:5-methylcytosine-specific restriction endonuclease McrA